jgi:CO dehydrogenase maturation factor
MCGAHAAVRSLVAEMIETYARPTVVDTEAGLEHLSRGTARHVDTMLIVIEPYYKSMETAARMHALASELGVGQVYTIANKSRSLHDEQALRQFCEQRGLSLLAVLPEDETIQRADRLGMAPLDYDATAPALTRLAEVAEKLRASMLSRYERSRE